MRLVLFVFAVSFAVAQTPAPIPRQATDTGASAPQKPNKETPAAQQPAAPAPAPTPGKDTPGNSGQNTGYQDKTKDDPNTVTVTKFPSVSVERDWIDFTTLGMGALLALIGITGIVIAICTLRDVEKQTEATRDSVGVLINSERAWVTISNVRSIKLEPRKLAVGYNQVFNRFRFDIKNSGKTVARLMELTPEHRILDRESVLPDAPVYTFNPTNDLGFIHGGVLVPDESLKGIGVEIKEWIDESKMNLINQGDLTLYVYGILRYFDFAETERRLQFCYRYLPSEAEDFDGNRFHWIIDGPKAYNTHT